MRPAEVQTLFDDDGLVALAERVQVKSIQVAEAMDARCLIMQGAFRAEGIGKTDLREHVIEHLSDLLVVLDDVLADASVVSESLPAWLRGEPAWS